MSPLHRPAATTMHICAAHLRPPQSSPVQSSMPMSAVASSQLVPVRADQAHAGNVRPAPIRLPYEPSTAFLFFSYWIACPCRTSIRTSPIHTISRLHRPKALSFVRRLARRGLHGDRVGCHCSFTHGTHGRCAGRTSTHTPPQLPTWSAPGTDGTWFRDCLSATMSAHEVTSAWPLTGFLNSAQRCRTS